VALAVVLVIAVVAAGAGAWYYLRPAGGQGALSLSFPEGASGPLDEGVSYELSVEGDPGGSASFRLVVDSEPIGSPQPTLESFAPPAGRHSVAVEVTRDSSVEITDPIEIYVIGELPEAGYRVNLVSVTADPASWSTAISAFDRLVAEGHTELSLLPSDRFASLLSGYWNLFVPGFGDNQDQAEAYCESFGLEIPHECFASRFDPNA
jgi:hypothetical protein